jgi:hypothetical protein
MRITTSLRNNHDPLCEAVSNTCMNGSGVVHCSPDMVQVPGIVAPISGKVVAEVTSPMSTLLLSGMVCSLNGTGLKGHTSNNSKTNIKELRS